VSAPRPLLLGEGERDVGRAALGDRRRPPCDFEGDLPRLVRRLSELAGGPPRFGYDAETIHAVSARIPRSGRPMRAGGKAKQLRDAVLAGLQDHTAVIALVDARAEELESLRRDVSEILAQCREREPDARVAIGVAVQEIEAWMLADPHGRVAAFGPAVGAQPVPDDLEAVADPKALWRERAGQCPAPDAVDPALHADVQRSKVWEALRSDVVRRACPAGFAPFADAVEGVILAVSRRSARGRE
jgi:hypothetical protein